MEPELLTRLFETGFATGVAGVLLFFVTRQLSEKVDKLTETQNKILLEMTSQTIYLSQVLQTLGRVASPEKKGP